MKHALLLSILALVACSPETTSQQIDDRDAAAADYPDLVPLEETLVLDTPRISENSEDELEARANRLKRRAQELRNTPVQ
ncbi:hypothetical protein [Shimia sp.]|uniref:hypothetical protein n=1 Tax=Shimia sp. TaxID=1954381 RepID=UPI0032974C01